MHGLLVCPCALVLKKTGKLTLHKWAMTLSLGAASRPSPGTCVTEGGNAGVIGNARPDTRAAGTAGVPPALGR